MLTTIFLDRDGVINDVVEREGVVSSPRSLEEFVIRPDFMDFYKAIEPMQLNLFVVSNQPDVARKLLSEDTLEQMNRKMIASFSFQEIIYCKHDDDARCLCRKPKPGMILSLLEKYAVKADEAIIIGDRYKDILAGQAAGVRTIHYCQGYNATVSCKPDYRVNRLVDALTLDIFQGLS